MNVVIISQDQEGVKENRPRDSVVIISQDQEGVKENRPRDSGKIQGNMRDGFGSVILCMIVYCSINMISPPVMTFHVATVEKRRRKHK